MWRKIKSALRQFILTNNEPESIALGLAIGVFVCVLPLYGLHTLLVVVFALLIPRANKIAILLGTNLSLPPTVPFITWAGYEIGRSLFWNRRYPPFDMDFFKHFDWKRLAEFYYPLFVGSVILGLLGGMVVYLVAVNTIRWKRKLRKADS
ncbi:MAG: DUF2062 domain-containing protein [Candidatus Omnitrophica bacterium]|nr:DUF2062 domain-containing protein [Candidatus Omnitrophota bacterium]